ncbi:protein phosphatase regulator [Conoideocrella luteorostrata]|uniref:Protein phosphatase regulator n=1 Tax=Conoideocrella luteorostrata TaxID=1105319 RepID=A0AAJ0FUL9_9HYPO|nr:protein phosphatase regulator [Conoideocrella luteorostrata]
MAAVLSTEESSYFSPSSLRRSHSQTSFAHNSSYRSTPTSHIPAPFNPPSKTYTESDVSSVPSSPPTIQAESTDVSFTSTPASNLSISSDFDETLGIDESPEDHFSLPLLSQEKFFLQPEFQPDDNLEPPPSPKTGDSYTVSPTEPETSGLTSGPDTPEVVEHAEDDTAVSSRPSRQVDYLSHDWKEEDIWSSWRYIISKRGEFANSARLENASWRTWMKARNSLKTISPEELNWLKDCDVTWLYGPLQCGATNMNPTGTEPSSVALSKTDSLVNMNKKPILKKRSMSEVMLQRSLISASLLKQATAAVQAQETRGVLKHRTDKTNTDYYVTYPLSIRRGSQCTSSSLAVSTDSSNASSPHSERKHIHFNEQVEQCIAIDVKEEDEDEFDQDHLGEDSDSDDGGVMMKRVKSKKRTLSSKKKKAKKTATSEGKIIAKLPSTTLKYRKDTPEPQETAMKHSTGVYRSPMISPSSSQETLRPTKQSSRFFFGEEDDGEGPGDGFAASSGWRSPPAGYVAGSLHRSPSGGSLTDEPAGMRRTPSGMFMPCEEGEMPAGDGIIGRVIDTVNTARDIAHVIWNVGWRK